LVAWIILLIWLCTKGTDGPNRFGSDRLKLAQAARHVAEGRGASLPGSVRCRQEHAAVQDTALTEGVLVQFENSPAIFEADSWRFKRQKMQSEGYPHVRSAPRDTTWSIPISTASSPSVWHALTCFLQDKAYNEQVLRDIGRTP
jgi:hypothetical protein